MARLAAEMKLCYYPTNPLAITELAKHLQVRPPDPNKKFDTVCALDPCAGRGEAIKQLTGLLGIPESQTYTVELDKDRCNDVKELIPEGHHIGPASFLGIESTGSSFGLAYVNPPFDQELGGGKREEMAFVQRAVPLLVVKGILVLICPLTALAGSGMFVDFLDANYEDLRVYRFPDGEDEQGRLIRPYKEIAVIGKRRKEVLPKDSLETAGALNKMDMRWRDSFQIEKIPPLGQVQPVSWIRGSPSYASEADLHVWEIPHSCRPNTFRKNAFTDEELDEQIANSPLNRRFEEPMPLEIGRPPLALDRGHLGLILASGKLDGTVHGPHGSHVVRGSSYKKQYKDEAATVSTENPETGAVTTKETLRERMITVIRCAVDYPSPEIFTFSNDVKEEQQEHVDADDDDE